MAVAWLMGWPVVSGFVFGLARTPDCGGFEVDSDRVARGKAVCKGLIEQLLEMIAIRRGGRRLLAFAVCAHRALLSSSGRKLRSSAYDPN
jgi:hypothetical protein